MKGNRKERGESGNCSDSIQKYSILFVLTTSSFHFKSGKFYSQVKFSVFGSYMHIKPQLLRAANLIAWRSMHERMLSHYNQIYV